jgi:hypothetical protein
MMLSPDTVHFAELRCSLPAHTMREPSVSLCLRGDTTRCLMSDGGDAVACPRCLRQPRPTIANEACGGLGQIHHGDTKTQSPGKPSALCRGAGIERPWMKMDDVPLGSACRAVSGSFIETARLCAPNGQSRTKADEGGGAAFPSSPHASRGPIAARMPGSWPLVRHRSR